MDSRSLFLTANADTVYYMSGLDLSKGPMVIEQPSGGIGTINDMWFSWIINIGAPGPDRGLGGKYLIVGLDYEGPLPEGGYFIARSKTNFALYASRANLVGNDPKPAVENIKRNMKVYPYQPGAFLHAARSVQPVPREASFRLHTRCSPRGRVSDAPKGHFHEQEWRRP
ncbi:MAG: DUF1254 domain-containing protein [Pseudochelatococcus sp.]|jgi:hypothetical protein|uniref:DUF1254 domain-containing protein n=1 Tax=Pseudochelatococcus sp. TaxID=2020869 RepID=UPI003D9309F4